MFRYPVPVLDSIRVFGCGTVSGGLGFSSGDFPAARTFIILLRMSNQNGAPSDAASAVKSNPAAFIIQSRPAGKRLGSVGSYRGSRGKNGPDQPIKPSMEAVST